MYAALILCLLGFVAAQQPVPCTTPPQWEGRLFEVNEQQRFMVRGRLSYDATYHRERLVDEVDIGSQASYYDTVALFDSQIEYIYDFRFRNCTRQRLTRPWRDFGIRPNSTSFGEGYIGTSAVPGAGVLVSLWGGNFTLPDGESIRTFGSWTYQSCLPVRRITHSSVYGRSERQFFDITAGISNPSVFIPRAECLTEEEYANRDVLFGQAPKKI